MEKWIGIVGIVTILFLSWLLSSHKKDVSFRMIISGLIMQLIIAVIFLKTSLGLFFFAKAQGAADKLLSFSDAGSIFLFGENFSEHFFAFKVLPTIIFMASLSQILFYYGVLQRIIGWISVLMQKTMRISGAEALVTAANIFLGQTEAPLFVRPYLPTMTKSEINVLMTSGMATVAGGVLAAYVGMGVSAGHLIAASFMSAPACIVIAKLMVPERETPLTMGSHKVDFKTNDVNVFEAAVNGASQGLMLALNVGAMLIAFVALVAMFNHAVGSMGAWFGWQLSFEGIMGWIFRPLAFLMGVPWADCAAFGELLGKKIVLNEFVAFMDLAEMIKTSAISPRAQVIATYALCGFANFSSIAIQVGGNASLAPERRKDFARLGLIAMIGGNFASFITASIAGLFL